MKSNKRYPKGRARRKRPEPPVTVRQMTDEEWTRAQERIGTKQRKIANWAKKETPYDAAKRAIIAGETFRSQKPSDYRRKRRRK